MELFDSILETKQFLTEKGFPDQTDTFVILGSGLGGFTDTINDPQFISYNQIPGFPDTTIQGHSGKLFTGTVAGKQVIAFSGRFHHYEGHSFPSTVLPVQLAKAFNTHKLLISNAAGAINTQFKIGDLMIIDDVSRLFQYILPSPTQPFKYNLYPVANEVRKIAASARLEVQRGTYLFVNGPNYETKAEIRAFRILGADAVGMSTVPELMEASRLNIRTAAISLITNMATGIHTGKLDHSEVKFVAKQRKDDFRKLVTELIRKL